MIYLDTHVVMWLYADPYRRLSKHTMTLIESGDLRISPMVVLELHLMREIKRLDVPVEELLGYLGSNTGLEICRHQFDRVVQHAAPLAWTRDPFDRVIVGQATLNNNILITKDSHILENYPHAVW